MTKHASRTSTTLDSLPAGVRVQIIRLRSLGDCVLTTPAIALLKSHRPDLEIDILVEPRFAAVFESNPHISRVLSPAPHRASFTLNLHGGTRSTWLTAASLASQRATFAHLRHAWLYNIHIPRAQQILGEERTVHTAEHLASAMFYLGVPQQPIPPSRVYIAPSNAQRPYAVLHPFASRADKAWSTTNFLQVAAHLRSTGVDPVILGAATDDTSPYSDYRTLTGAPLREAIARIAGASLFIGNDSGPAHIAAAARVPLVALYSVSDPVVWAPWKAHARQLIAPSSDINSIAPKEVLHAIDQLKVAA